MRVPPVSPCTTTTLIQSTQNLPPLFCRQDLPTPSMFTASARHRLIVLYNQTASRHCVTCRKYNLSHSFLINTLSMIFPSPFFISLLCDTLRRRGEAKAKQTKQRRTGTECVRFFHAERDACLCIVSFLRSCAV